MRHHSHIRIFAWSHTHLHLHLGGRTLDLLALIITSPSVHVRKRTRTANMEPRECYTLRDFKRYARKEFPNEFASFETSIQAILRRRHTLTRTTQRTASTCCSLVTITSGKEALLSGLRRQLLAYATFKADQRRKCVRSFQKSKSAAYITLHCTAP